MRPSVLPGLTARAVVLCAMSSVVAAQDMASATASVFQRYAARVVKVQVVDTSSGAKSTIGSGFFASAAGHVVTNYHVISSVVNKPGSYRVQLDGANGVTTQATVIAVDAVHDLAVLKTDLRGRPFFDAGQAPLAQGTRLFSLGNPKDLGLSIVEGTYNGLLQHSVYPRIHLTASLNPGMSGGPTTDERGRLIGVNVSTMGNQMSFLVPVDRVEAIMRRATARDVADKAPSLAQVGEQLRDHQGVYLRGMFDTNTTRIDFGPFRVPTSPTPLFRCWGDASNDANDPYETVTHRCVTDDDIFLSEDQSTGLVTIRHELVSSTKLNRMRLFSQYSAIFGYDLAPGGDEEFVTNWKCTSDNVRTDAKVTMRAVMCLRRYRTLGELYDGTLKLAVLGAGTVGLVSTLNVTGATFENITRVAERYIGTITWR
jgi:serine protease Do